MKICITVGHSILKDGNCTSASGVVNEYQYCKALAPVLTNLLKKEGHTVDMIICPEIQFTKATEEKDYKLPKINGKKYDLCLELHLNSFNKTAKGAEVLYVSNSGKIYAERVMKKLATLFTNRGVKLRNDLYILNGTDCPTILLETFFCDNAKDYRVAKDKNYEGVAKLIAEGILNKTISDSDSNSKPSESLGSNSLHKNCVLYEGTVDWHIAEIFSWYLEDCALVKVDNFKSYTANNLYVIGEIAEKKLIEKNLPDRYTTFAGIDRFETLDKALAFINLKRK
ncbi:N-acetylmuramoyl-L-alanine amidase [Metaclostridioides mangenotii]|uniref:N-acetylmuramoyl-L-alanine amidase n=1 Tax=Metaclostridioides mangenotii TaxID=1540 RepID=UPI0004834F60|nr:N-acetylmuramoyl-L-alanine amidase [Clostridioides mangenotii]